MIKNRDSFRKKMNQSFQKSIIFIEILGNSKSVEGEQFPLKIKYYINQVFLF